MHNSLAWKLYDPANTYQAAATTPALLARLLEPGWTIRYGHREVCWREGVDEGDVVAVCHERRQMVVRGYQDKERGQ